MQMLWQKGLSSPRGSRKATAERGRLVTSAGGVFELVEYRHNVFVGVFERAKYQNHEFELHPGDCLFVYTDGVLEANDSSEDMFGEQRLLDALNQHVDATPEELVGTVFEAVSQFRGDAPQFDDITMLCFRLNDE